MLAHSGVQHGNHRTSCRRELVVATVGRRTHPAHGGPATIARHAVLRAHAAALSERSTLSERTSLGEGTTLSEGVTADRVVGGRHQMLERDKGTLRAARPDDGFEILQHLPGIWWCGGLSVGRL